MVGLRTKASWRGIPHGQLESVLADILPLLRTIPYDEFGIDSLLQFLDRRVLQLWVYGTFQTILITEIVHHPNYSVLVLKFGAGKITPEILRAGRGVVLPWAKMYGCTRVEVVGRRGWGKVLGLSPRPPAFVGEI